VLFDPNRAVTLDREMLHERTDYTPYAGMAVQGYPVATVARGAVIVRDGVFQRTQGRGRFIARPV